MLQIIRISLFNYNFQRLCFLIYKSNVPTYRRFPNSKQIKDIAL
jgi:hypothetical protein